MITERIFNNINAAVNKMITGKDTDVKAHATYSKEEIKTYLKACRLMQPFLSEGARNALRNKWVGLRTSDLKISGQKNYRITVRQLESLIRLSEAFAKFELSEYVSEEHVASATELLEKT